MKKIILLLFVLFFFFISCTTHNDLKTTPSERTSAEDFQTCLKQGMQYLNQKEYSNAVFQFRGATNLKPKSERALNLLGITYFMKKDYKKAKAQFEKVISFNNSYAQAVCNLGAVYFKEGNMGKAEKMFRKSIELSSTMVSPYYSLGNLLISKGKKEEGFSFLAKAVKMNPCFLESNNSFVTVSSYATVKDPEIWFEYAKLYASVGDFEKTSEYLDKAKATGFRDWKRVKKENEFEGYRNWSKLK